MKLYFLRTPGSLPQFREGTTHEVKPADAKKLVAAGIAVEAGGPDDPTAVKAAAETSGGETEADDEEIEAAANKAVFTARGEDSKANRPPPAKTVSTAAPTAQRSRPQPTAGPGEPVPPVEAFDGGEGDDGDGLDAMTVADLRELAGKEKIDLTAHKKAEIVDEIRAARKK